MIIREAETATLPRKPVWNGRTGALRAQARVKRRRAFCNKRAKIPLLIPLAVLNTLIKPLCRTFRIECDGLIQAVAPNSGAMPGVADGTIGGRYGSQCAQVGTSFRAFRYTAARVLRCNNEDRRCLLRFAFA